MGSIGFVGAGRIARIMLEGWKRAGVSPKKVLAFDCQATATAKLAAAYGSVEAASLADVAACDLVIVGLHPPALAEVLPKVAQYLRPEAIVLSLAPKVRLAALSGLLGGFARLARQNPNAPSIVDRGFNPIAFADALSQADRQALLDLLKPLGECPIVGDRQIEAYALISAMGPTYLWFQFRELECLGVEFGLSETAAREAVAAMVHGAAATLLESDLAADDVTDLVPVKPLAGDEEAFVAAYRNRLKPLHAKLAA